MAQRRRLTARRGPLPPGCSPPPPPGSTAASACCGESPSDCASCKDPHPLGHHTGVCTGHPLPGGRVTPRSPPTPSKGRARRDWNINRAGSRNSVGPGLALTLCPLRQVTTLLTARPPGMKTRLLVSQETKCRESHEGKHEPVFGAVVPTADARGLAFGRPSGKSALVGLLPCPMLWGDTASSPPIADSVGPLPGVSREGRCGWHGLDRGPGSEAPPGGRGSECALAVLHLPPSAPRPRYLCSLSRRYFSRSALLIFSRGCRWSWCVFTFWLST